MVDTDVVPWDMDEYNNTIALYFDLDSSGSDIVYSTCEYGDGADYYTYTYDIAKYSIDEEKKRRLSKRALDISWLWGWQQYPVWSPDGSRIAFIEGPTGDTGFDSDGRDYMPCLPMERM